MTPTDPPPTSASFRRVGVVARTGLTAAADLLGEIANWLQARGVQAVFDTETAALARDVGRSSIVPKNELAAAVDMVLVLGGDGTLLGMADRIADAGTGIPILGVNFGGLGFLTEITLAELYPSLESALAGTSRIDARMMLRARAERAGELYTDRSVLNDVVIMKGALSRIIDLSLSVSGEFVSRFKADGLILASPTGSTAYNLAAGGPILHPHTEAIVITPIAPHTLTNRPVVIASTEEISIQPLVDGSNEEIFVTFDGQSGFRLQANDTIRVTRSERTLRLIRASTRGYFEVLRQKLKWFER
jgi:NAD+ kinase